MMEIDRFYDYALWTKILWSVVCGIVIGLERHLHRKPLDLRLSVLICLGTMTFIHLGVTVQPPSQDMTRVLGQVVTGVGFLGAGAIITRQGLVMGLTSAAVVWVLAAVGAAIGFGYYEMGISISIVVVLVLMVVQWFEDWTERLVQPKNEPSEKYKR